MAPEAPTPPVEDAVDQLFAGPPGDFVAGRETLVKQLRKAGEKERAAEVKTLRRPTAAAWAVNQLALREADDVAELLELGDRLRVAHGAMLEGKGAESVREVVAARRRLTEALSRRAVALLGPGGDSQREAISHTLEAAVADADYADAVRRGRLSKELPAPAGFGGLESLPWPEPRTPPDPAPPGPPRAPAPARQTSDAPSPAEERARLERLHLLVAERDAARNGAEQAAEEAAAAHLEVRRIRELLEAAEAHAKDADRRSRGAQAAAAQAFEALRSAEKGSGDQGPQDGSRS